MADEISRGEICLPASGGQGSSGSRVRAGGRQLGVGDGRAGLDGRGQLPDGNVEVGNAVLGGV